MRRPLLVVLGALLLGPLLAACGPSSPAQVTQARSHVDVASPDLVAFKKRTDIPDCPRLPATKVGTGVPRRVGTSSPAPTREATAAARYTPWGPSSSTSGAPSAKDSDMAPMTTASRAADTRERR